MIQRKTIIKESREIAIQYGGTYFIWVNKIIIDKIRPLVWLLHLKNKRVKNI